MKTGLTQDQGKLKPARVTPQQSRMNRYSLAELICFSRAVVVVDGIPSIHGRLNSAKFIWTENMQKVPLTTLTVFLPARARTR